MVTTDPITEATLLPVRAGALALKIFAFSTRGVWAERERLHIFDFVARNIDCSDLARENIDMWLRKLPVYFSNREDAEVEFKRLIVGLSSTLRKECRITALAISQGSGRRPIDPALLEKINADFST